MGAGRSAHPVKTEELKRMGRRSPYAHRVRGERGKQRRQGARAFPDVCNGPSPRRGKQQGRGREHSQADC